MIKEKDIDEVQQFKLHKKWYSLHCLGFFGWNISWFLTIALEINWWAFFSTGVFLIFSGIAALKAKRTIFYVAWFQESRFPNGHTITPLLKSICLGMILVGTIICIFVLSHVG